METLVHADIFFFVTVILEIVLGILFTVVLVYLIKIMRDVDRLNKKIQEEVNDIIDDVHHARETIKNEGIIVKHVMKYVMGLVYKKASKLKKIKKHLTEE